MEENQNELLENPNNNFQDPNILLATLLNPHTKSLKDVSIQVKLQTEELLCDKVEELKLETLSLPIIIKSTYLTDVLPLVEQ
ncbi:9330_t:CDS:2 [Funneliformis caledonium]|uniref:9330_t:CDS:1 n=1 Tax=Funneliformis caledonium TaxID=1117310 RepID=A0A9N9G4X2_9GLOM|nr:9330_t:CDS:2 [Funneliformis caledonium]